MHRSKEEGINKIKQTKTGGKKEVSRSTVEMPRMFSHWQSTVFA